MLLPATGLALFFGLSVGFSSVAQANNFSPKRELIKRESTISISDALERSSVRSRGTASRAWVVYS